MPYCQFCGKKLEDGETCTCEMQQPVGVPPTPQMNTKQAAPQQAAPQHRQFYGGFSSAQQASQQAAPQQAAPQHRQFYGGFSPAQQAPQQAAPQQQPMQASPLKKIAPLNELITYLKAYFADPAQAVRSVMDKNDWTLTITLSVIRMLAVGLAVYGFLNKSCGSITQIITSGVANSDRYFDYTDYYFGGITFNMTASFFKCLGSGLMIGAISMLLFTGMTYGLAKIQRGSVSFAKAFQVSAANGVLTTALLLLSFLCSYISIALCAAFAALTFFSWIICGVLTVRTVCPNSNSGKFWLLYFVGIVLIVAISFFVIPRMLIYAVGGICVNYMGKTTTLQGALDYAFRMFEGSGAKNIWDFFWNFIWDDDFNPDYAGMAYDIFSSLQKFAQ